MLNTEPHVFNLDTLSSIAESIIKACYQCGNCTSVCPLRRVSKFNPRRFIHNAQLGGSLSDDELTMCLTCAKCYEVCPQEVNIPEFIRLSRVDKIIDEKSYAHHNVFNLLQIFMAEMTEKGMEFNYEGEIDPDSNIAYFPGCIDLFDRFLGLEKTKFHPIGQSAINLMNKVGIKPNVISLKCCGHDAYWTGDNESFSKVRQFNTTTIKESNIKTLVTSCAECFYTFSELYDLDIEIKHISQFIEEHQAALGFKGEDITVTYHDPCRLGRFMKEYESPRTVLRNTGATLKELPLNKQFTNCCGVSAWLRCDDQSRALMLSKLEEAKQVVGNDGTLTVACTKCFAHLNCVLEDKEPQHDYQLQVKELGMLIDEISTKNER
ncbi:MAG: (Fe-S)-binding protein [Promethearchaeota archaeon]